MPPVPRFTTDAVRELFAELRFASVESRTRQMDQAERLVREIDPDLLYPEEFVHYRVTGHRSRGADTPVTLAGAALRADLVILVQRVSGELDLPPRYAGREALSLETVRRELGVSPRTLQRYRRQGLVCHYVSNGGPKKLHCFRDALAAFTSSCRERLGRAHRFSRLTDAERRRLIDEARGLREREGITLNEAARRLAPPIGRAIETVRAILQRHDRRSERPIFDEYGPLRERDLEFVLRAWHFGVPSSAVARRFGKATTSIHHAIGRMRRRRLAQLPLTWVDLPTFRLPDCEAIILGAAAVTTGLDDRLGDDMLAMARSDRPADVEIDVDLEGALLAGYNLLKRRCRDAIETLPASPSASDLDAIETDLRWAALLKRRLVELSLPAVLRAVDQYLHRPLAEEPADVIQRIVRLALDVSSDTVEGLDPTRQRLARSCGFATDRALARSPMRPATRAAARHDAGSLPLQPADTRFCPWQTWLDPRPDLRAHLSILDADARTLVQRRYGWTGAAPVTLRTLADEAGTTVAAIGASLRAAERRLRSAARGAVG